MKGYKGFNSDLTCRGFQYEVGKTYELEKNERLDICNCGFHFCKKVPYIHEYYGLVSSDTRVCEIEALGDIQEEGNKCATNKIKIIRELTKEEIELLKNDGEGNTGIGNVGDRNTGDRNTGYRNTGDWNTGYRNTGDRNTGYRNTGDWNTGYRNTGDWNTGDWNTGDRNTGDRNTGYRNTGDWNTGDRNTGDRNTGDWNTGDWNTGDWNTGDRNTGDWNTGDWNTGDWNKTNRSSGVFCNEEPKMLMFNKPTDMTYDEWRNSEAYDILWRKQKSVWVWFNDMTDEEKKEHPSAETCDGYLKEIEYEKSSKEWWNQLENYEKKTIFQLPNFDLAVFNDIMALEISEEEYKKVMEG